MNGKKNMCTIRVNESLSNSTLHEHKCQGIIKRLYKSTGKRDDKQGYENILEAAVVYNPEQFTDNSPLSSDKYDPAKNLSVRKSFRQFSDVLDIK